MHYKLDPNVGAGALKFNADRTEIRRILNSSPLVKHSEPENDFYEIEGLILGYDDKDKLEFIEIVKPSTAELSGLDFFSLTIPESLEEMKKLGFSSEFDDGGYNFEEIGVAFYCPLEALESVSLYKKGYYD